MCESGAVRLYRKCKGYDASELELGPHFAANSHNSDNGRLSIPTMNQTCSVSSELHQYST